MYVYTVAVIVHSTIYGQVTCLWFLIESPHRNQRQIGTVEKRINEELVDFPNRYYFPEVQ